MKRSIGTAALGLGLVAMTATAQDMMRHVDLSSPDMVSAEMTRGEVEAALAAATAAAPADFTGKRLSGLDLSGLNLSGAIFRARTAQQDEARRREDSIVPSSTRHGCSRRTSRAQA